MASRCPGRNAMVLVLLLPCFAFFTPNNRSSSLLPVAKLGFAYLYAKLIGFSALIMFSMSIINCCSSRYATDHARSGSMEQVLQAVLFVPGKYRGDGAVSVPWTESGFSCVLVQPENYAFFAGDETLTTAPSHDVTRTMLCHQPVLQNMQSVVATTLHRAFSTIMTYLLHSDSMSKIWIAGTFRDALRLMMPCDICIIGNDCIMLN